MWSMGQGTNCHKCQYYYVTWDKAFPHGCRAMGFKSQASPAKVTEQVSGHPCLSFVERNPAPAKR